MSDIRIEQIPPHGDQFHSVLELGRLNSGTLGFMPEGAFVERAAMGHLLAAVASERRVAGYLLYRVSDERAVIVHLCIAPEFRRHGVASALVRALCRRAAHLRGIYLRCRSDYDANTLWPRLGFRSLGEVPGRSLDRHPLTRWWQGFGKPDLLTASRPARDATLDVVVDHNIWLELVGLVPPSREVAALLADWLPRFEILATPEHGVEIDRDPMIDRRKDAHRALTRSRVIEVPVTEVEGVLAQVSELLRPRTAQDLSDARHVAYAITAGKRLFITRDEGVLQRAENLGALGLRVFRPGEFIAHVDEHQDASRYEPALLADRCLSTRRVDAGGAATIVRRFLDHGAGERKGELHHRLDALLARPKEAEAMALMLDDEVVGLVGTERAEQELHVRLLRLRAHPVAATVAHHILQWLAIRALRSGCQWVEVTDGAASRVFEDAYERLGYAPNGETVGKLCLSGCRTTDDVRAVVEDLPATVSDQLARDLVALLVAAGEGDQMAARLLERRVWPARVSGTGLPAVLVPIQPRWARELFDTRLAQKMLWAPVLDVMLRTENVYYRSSRTVRALVPGARILWYVSSDRGERVGAIRACSTCEEVVVGDPGRLFRRFRRLGIYTWREVAETARSGGQVMAVRFGMTSELDRAVHLGELRALLAVEGRGLSLRSPQAVPESVVRAAFGRNTE